MSFTEKELENVILEKIQSQGYNYIHGDNIERPTKEDVLIESDLTKFLENKYRNEEITTSEINSIITSFKLLIVNLVINVKYLLKYKFVLLLMN